MAAPPPPEGVSFFVSWGVIDWLLTAIASAITAVIGWVWHLGGRIEALKVQLEESKQDRKAMRESIRALKVQAEEDTRQLEAKVEKLADKLEEIREAIPSRTFIETQLNQLHGRIDRTMEVKLRDNRN